MKLTDIFQKSRELEARVIRDGKAGERELAQAQELCNQFIDELERLENTATVKPYLSADVVADKILSWWYPNE